MILGHEIAGTIEEVGDGVTHLVPGTRVAVNPSRACNTCRYCREGLRNERLTMHFMGSAMRFPHAQGAFRQTVPVDAGQAVPLAPGPTLAEAAVAAPPAAPPHSVPPAGTPMATISQTAKPSQRA